MVVEHLAYMCLELQAGQDSVLYSRLQRACSIDAILDPKESFAKNCGKLTNASCEVRCQLRTTLTADTLEREGPRLKSSTE
jgi:hypothetical protein